MTDRPIPFMPEMVRAILDGRKTMTRRVVQARGDYAVEDGVPYLRPYVTGEPEPVRVPCPYGMPGDRLWVRETWAPEPGYEESHNAPEWAGGGGQPGRVVYRADERPGLSHGVRRWRPPMFMPRWASRITLEVTGVRVERLRAANPWLWVISFRRVTP